MGIKIEDYVDVEKKLSELGCRPAIGIAMLPKNFETASKIDDFRQVSEAATVKKLFRAAGLELADVVDRTQRPPYIQNNYADWVGPTLFLSSALWSQNPHAVSVALSVIANYLTDIFKGIGSDKIKLEFVVEKTMTRQCTRVSYEGNVAGITALKDVLQKVVDE